MKSAHLFWPYDEMTASPDDAVVGRYLISAPWIKFKIDIAPKDFDRADTLLKKLTNQSLVPEDMNDLIWFFSGLSNFPLCYLLPRHSPFGIDVHSLSKTLLNYASPQALLQSLLEGSRLDSSVIDFVSKMIPNVWSWEIETAFQFSRTQQGLDPESLFSVVRRFHLLNDLESNQTGRLMQTIHSLKGEPEKFKQASALVVRQNHYVTEKCDSVLKSAMPISQTAENELLKFIQAEAGHDKLLSRALHGLGTEPASVPVIHSIRALMEIFRCAGERNFLGFSMIVDIFERSAYRDEDPLATLLKTGGFEAASRQIDVHREINDAGGHENVALGFLHAMKPVSDDYALEATRLAELATLVVHQVSVETLLHIDLADHSMLN